jgi:uncharacterized cupredoxin-like copper-binding protein
MKLRLLTVAVLFAAGCNGGAAAVSAASVELYEPVIAPSAHTFAAGKVALAVTNTGQFAHTLVVTAESGRVVTATDLIERGESVDLLVDLAPGTYQFTCRIVAQLPDGSLLDHYEAGMNTTVTVG